MNSVFLSAVAAGIILVTSANSMAGISANRHGAKIPHPVSMSAGAVEEQPFPNFTDTKDETANIKETEGNFNYFYYSSSFFSEDGYLDIFPSDSGIAKIMIVINNAPHTRLAYTLIADYDEDTKTYSYDSVTKKELYFKNGTLDSEKETELNVSGELFTWKDLLIWNDEAENFKDHVFRLGRKPSARLLEEYEPDSDSTTVRRKHKRGDDDWGW